MQLYLQNKQQTSTLSHFYSAGYFHFLIAELLTKSQVTVVALLCIYPQAAPALKISAITERAIPVKRLVSQQQLQR